MALRLVTVIGVFTGRAPSNYPSRSVEIIVSYGAGGSTDFVARTVAQKLSEALGQSSA